MMLRKIGLILLFCFLSACGKKPSHQKMPLMSYTTQLSTVHKTLHFTGTIQPLKENTLTSPVDAVVETMHVHYGQVVHKGDVVFTLNSAQMQQQYNEVLTDYLKAKDNYSMARTKFIGTEELWQAGLLSKNNYVSEKASVNTARITLMQASRKLSELFEKTNDDKFDELSNLSFAEFNKVRQALTRPHHLIQIKASADGVLLYPPKTENENVHLSSGITIKTGQPLALIGDLTGVSVEINVPEVDISEIKIGMHADIHGVAFGKQLLKGHLVAVNAQASTANGGGLPSFTAIVEVHALTPTQQALIKVGMSATIELAVDSSDKLLIPIAAISQQAGKSIVRIRSSDGVIIVRQVVTGMVDGDRVAIEAGLQVGDEVVYG